MVLTNFNGTGIGFGFGAGCGFGVGWGFGCMPLNFLGLGAGGGCGVGVGLGWGFGAGFGSKYRSSTVISKVSSLIRKVKPKRYRHLESFMYPFRNFIHHLKNVEFRLCMYNQLSALTHRNFHLVNSTSEL